MPDLAKLVDDLSALTVIEAAQLSKMLEEKWGVSAAAPIAMTAVGGGAAAPVAEAAAEKTEFDVILAAIGELDHHFCRRDWIAREGDRCRSGEHRRQDLEHGASNCPLGKPVLRHSEGGPDAAHVSPQLGHLGDIEPGLMGHDHARRLCEIPLQCLDQLLFLNSIHFVSEPGRG